MKRSQSLGKSLDDVKYEQYVNNLHDRLPQLTDPSDIDCQRWPWELLQNAKDTVVKRKNPEDRYVDVSIKYYTDNEGKKKLYFQHNGDQFTNKAITGLIWKFSAEKRNEQTTEDGLTRDKQSTGRFGTGFMTTHALSLTVDVSGSLFHDDPEVMRNVSVDFTLHREGPDDEAYKAGVDRTEREIDENMDKRPIPADEILPTRFTYHLNKDASEKAARMGIENVRANAAQTMLFCPSVRSITVINEENNVTFKITRKNNDESKDIVKETVFVEESSDRNEPVTRRFISMEIEEPSKEISSHWKAKDRNLRLHVAVEVDNNNNILPIPSTSPAVYCSLPLIGFESMSLPFYINSNDFEPATERTSLYLKKKRFEIRTNEETDEEEQFYLQSGINWSIFERSLSLYESVVDYLIDNGYNKRYNLINGLGDILNGAWGIETKNCLASRFILPLRNMLVQKNLVKTGGGYRSINSDVKFVECSKDCDLHEFYEICKTIYGTNLAVEDENENWVALKWGRFTFETGFDEKKPESENPAIPTVKYDKVAKYIEDATCLDNLTLIIENDSDTDTNFDVEHLKEFEVSQKLQWLNKFYEWLEVLKITNIADKKIVPNRLGNFCSIEQGCDLKDASDIPTSIFNFMKRISIDWDANLLMEGVQHITLAKETKDNVVVAIKDRSKEIRDERFSDNASKLTSLLPLLMALPANEDGRTQDFYEKRSKILSILKTVYKSETEDVESVTLELKAETWEDSDKWLMSLVSTEVANREHLDVIEAEDTEEQIAEKYCTYEWLSDIVSFMFDKGYLHLDDITESESPDDVISIIPNRYGDFKPINLLYKQGLIPNKLLDETLNDTGFDIKKVLLYEGFVLNEKAKITDYQITTLASKYNEYFEGDDNDKKESVANFLLHLVPECGEQYKEIRDLYDEFNNVEDTTITVINTSELGIWKGAKDYMIGLLAENASECKSVFAIGKKLKNFNNEEELNYEQKSDCWKLGMSWLNRLAQVIENGKVSVDEELSLVPDWYGKLHPETEMIYDGSILGKYYERVNSLIEIVEGVLWSYIDASQKEEGDDEIVSKIVNSDYRYVGNYQNNTDEKLFGIVDKLISYCCNHNDTSWRDVLKNAINSLLHFFEENSSSMSWGEKPKWIQYFHETYKVRKELYYDYICDAKTKAQISRISENFDTEEIEELIREKEAVKKILAYKDHYVQLEEENKNLQARVEELSALDRIIKDCSPEKVKELVEQFLKLQNANPADDNADDNSEYEVVKVQKVEEFTVKTLDGDVTLKDDYEQYCGLPVKEKVYYVSEAKLRVAKYFKELNYMHPELGLRFDDDLIHMDSYSQLYGIYDKDDNMIPLVVHSYLGPQYRYFTLNWYDWQLLSKPGSMLWVVSLNGGLQCIPLYALPIRKYHFDLEYKSHQSQAIMHALASAGKMALAKSNEDEGITFEFGNQMPTGFNIPRSFDFIPNEITDCVESIEQTCTSNAPVLMSTYRSDKNIPIVSNKGVHSRVLKYISDGVEKERDNFSFPETKAEPIVYAGLEDTL